MNDNENNNTTIENNTSNTTIENNNATIENNTSDTVTLSDNLYKTTYPKVTRSYFVSKNNIKNKNVKIKYTASSFFIVTSMVGFIYGVTQYPELHNFITNPLKTTFLSSLYGIMYAIGADLASMFIPNKIKMIFPISLSLLMLYLYKGQIIYFYNSLTSF